MTPVPLKRLATVRVSNVDKKSVDGEPPVRLCNYTDVYYRNEITPRQEFMTASASPAQISAFRLHRDDVIITKDSETAEDIGVPAYVRSTAPDLVCGYHLAMLRPEPRLLDGRFLYWFMSSTTARDQLAVAATGVTRFGLRADSTGSMLVPSWPVEQQRAIADYLDTETARIEALIDKKDQLIGRLIEQRSATTLAGVGGAFTSTGPRVDATLQWLPSHPVDWRTAKLTLVAELGSGHTPSRDHPEWWENCSIPWITTGEVAQMRNDRVEFLAETREAISELGMANSSATVRPAGTVVLSRTASAGYSAIMGNHMATSQDFVTWTCRPLLVPRFLLLCLRAMRPDLLNRLAQGSTHKTIYMPDIESICIPLPPLNEQHAIVRETWQRLRVSDQTVDCLNRQIALLQEHRQGLITAAVSGQLDVSRAA